MLVAFLFSYSLFGQSFNSELGVTLPDIHVSGYGDHGAFYESNTNVASNSKNGFIIVWEDTRSGYSDIWAQKLDQSGVPEGDNFRVSSDNSIKSKSKPFCAMDKNGTIMILWRFNNYIYSKLYSPDLTVLVDEFRISPSGMYGSGSTVTSLPDGGFLVAFAYDATDELYLQAFDQDGLKDGDYVLVHTGDCYDFTDMKIFADENVIYFSWIESVYAPERQYIMSLNTDLSIKGQARLIRESIYWFGYDLGRNLQGKLEVYFGEENGAGQNILRTTYNDDCSISEAPIPVSPSIANSYTSPRLIKRSGTKTQIVSLLGGQLVMFEIIDGDEAEDYEFMGDDSGFSFINVQKSGLTVSKNSNGNQIIVFTDKRHQHLYPHISAETDVFGQLITENSVKIGTNFKIDDSRSADIDIKPSVSINSMNHKLVSWQYREEFNTNVLCQNIDADNNLIGGNKLAPEDQDSASQVNPSTASGKGSTDLVIWIGSNEYNYDWGTQDMHVMGQVYSKETGSLVGLNMTVRGGSSDIICYRNDVAARPDGGFLVVWEEMNESWRAVIRGQVVSESGILIGDMFDISPTDETSDCTRPEIGIDVSGNVVVIWRVDQKRKIDLQRFSSGMVPIDEVCTAYEPQGYSLSGEPSLAIGNNGNFCIVAEESKGIFLQYFLSDGTKQGDPIEVSDKQSYFSWLDLDLSASVCLSPDGQKTVVAWSSDKFSKHFPKLLARVYENGEAVGPIEIINEQGHKPNAHAYFWKNGLACNNEQIVFAWSENRTDRNLDIYCKTTNWSLTGIKKIPLNRRSIKVWPVPSNEKVYFGGDSESFEILDISGKFIRELNQPEWDLKNQENKTVSKGIYFVRNDRNETGKIIIH